MPFYDLIYLSIHVALTPPASPSTATTQGGFNATPESTWSDKAQRGHNPGSAQATERGPSSTSGGLIDQSLNGSNLKNELQDAKQGVDRDTRRDS